MHLGHACVELPCLSQMNTSPPNIVLPFLNSHTTLHYITHGLLAGPTAPHWLPQPLATGPLSLHWLAQMHWAPLTLLVYPAPLAHSDSTGLQ